ncbi:MAG: transposase, partial [Planctomycetaceae bacterium]|nr:transposase [Planctomycetaceae bacterium]
SRFRFNRPLLLMPPIRYSDKVRRQAVARALSPSTTIAQVAGEVGCSHDTIHRWLRQHRQQQSPVSGSKDTATFIPVTITDPVNPSAENVNIRGWWSRYK